MEIEEDDTMAMQDSNLENIQDVNVCKIAKPRKTVFLDFCNLTEMSSTTSVEKKRSKVEAKN